MNTDRSLRNLFWNLVLGLLALAVPFGTLIYYLNLDRGESRQERRGAESLARFPEPAPRWEEESPGPPEERRALAVEGRVYAGSGEPLGEGKLWVGGEEVILAADGSFRLDPLPRPHLAPLRLDGNGGEAVRFEDVVAGDDDSGGQSTTGIGSDLVTRRPERLRWTIHVLDPGGASLDPGPRDSSAFTIVQEAILIEDWGRGGRVRVQGRTNLPDGLHVYTTISFAGSRVAACMDPGTIEGGRFENAAALSPDLRLYSGTYDVTSSFHPVLEDPVILLEWKAGQGPRFSGSFTEVVAKHTVSVGDPAAAVEEDRAVAAYVSGMLRDAVQFRRRLESRVEEIVVLGKGWDPEFLKRRREAGGSWWAEESPIDKDGRFDESGWRRFLDEEWRPGVSELIDRHREEAPRKYEEVSARTEQLLRSLLQMSRAYSLFVVYPQFGLPPHENDFYFDERGKEDLFLLKSLIDDQLKNLERFTRLVEE